MKSTGPHPKTQSALLEAMEERQVTVEGTTRLLDEPFYVIATQNPLEQSGTFPLPESQLDRFLMRINVPVIPRRRGIFNPGPLTVSTRYPFGLVRCRFKLHVDVECLVYPEPLHGAPYGGGDGRDPCCPLHSPRRREQQRYVDGGRCFDEDPAI